MLQNNKTCLLTLSDEFYLLAIPLKPKADSHKFATNTKLSLTLQMFGTWLQN